MTDLDTINQVVVFADSRSDRIAVAKSILMSADTPFWVRGEGIQDLFGWGRFPVGTNIFVGPIEILVCQHDAADSRAMLADLASCEPLLPPPENQPESVGDRDVSSSLFWGRAKLAAKVATILILGYWALALLLSLMWGTL